MLEMEAAARDTAHRSQENVAAMEAAARTAGEEASAQLALAQANHAATPCTLKPGPPTLNPET